MEITKKSTSRIAGVFTVCHACGGLGWVSAETVAARIDRDLRRAL